MTNGNLLIAAVQMSDRDNYTCVAENIAGIRYSKMVSLTVIGMSIHPYTSSRKCNNSFANAKTACDVCDKCITQTTLISHNILITMYIFI